MHKYFYDAPTVPGIKQNLLAGKDLENYECSIVSKDLRSYSVWKAEVVVMSPETSHLRFSGSHESPWGIFTSWAPRGLRLGRTQGVWNLPPFCPWP